MKTLDDIQADFEASMRAALDAPVRALQKMENGRYLNETVQAAWFVWVERDFFSTTLGKLIAQINEQTSVERILGASPSTDNTVFFANNPK